MAIDISTDLIIAANGQILSTPTVDGIYDTGGVPGQYDPGKDYSPLDNISKGQVVIYGVNISLNSQTNQVYPIDRLTIAAADILGNLTYINIYKLNDDPNALNTVDTGVNTLVTNTNATLIRVILDSNIQSNSTLSTEVPIQLSSNAFWKTKLEPNIVIIAEKDGKQATFTFKLPPVKLAPKAYFTSIISTNESFASEVTYSNGAFTLPFQVLSNIRTIPNIIRLADNPDFASVTYRIDLTAQVNNILPVALLPNGFTFTPPSGFTVTDTSYTGSILAFTLTGPYKTIVSQEYITSVTATVPYTPAPGETNATIQLHGNWETGNAVTVIANNNYQILYDLLNVGFINGVAPLVDLTNGGIGALKLRQVVSNLGLYLYSIEQYVDATHDDLFYQAANSQYVLLADSQVTGIRPASVPSVLLQYTDLNGIEQSQTVIFSFYSQTFAYAPTTAPNYNPNDTIQSILLGTIPSGSYQSIIDSGHKPTARIITLLQDPWIGTNFDPMKPHRIVFNDAQFDPIDAALFKQLYDNDPTENFTSYLHSYTSLNTILSSTEEGYLLYGHLMAPMDNFQLRNGTIYLNLGTTAKTEPITTTQFNDISIVQNQIPVPEWFSEFENGIIQSNGAASTIIADYTQQYYFVFRRKAQAINYWNTQPIILIGTPIEFTIPLNLAPYFLISDTPYIQDMNGIKTPILNYQYDGFTIKFIMPVTFSFDFRGPGIYFPIRFIVPNENVIAQFTAPSIPLEDIVANLPGSILNYFPSDTPYYHVQFFPFPSTLIGVEIDNTGLSVAPHIYPNGTSVKYTGVVYNLNFDTADYYTFNTVPTNEYNEIETSNNSQKAYINSITTFNPGTEVYYQTEDKVTLQDILMSKVLQGPVNLMDYYNNTIVNTWAKWNAGDSLPNNVVMLSSFTPDILKGTFARIDYDVTIQMDVNTTNLYINDASFKYFSTGSGLEAHSNIVEIRNMPNAVNIPVKEVTPAVIDLADDRTAVFTITYPIPETVNTDPVSTLLLTDQIDSCFEVLSGSTNLNESSNYYTITYSLVDNFVSYRIVTNIPQGQTGDLPNPIIVTIRVRYTPNTCCPQKIPNTAFMQLDQQAQMSTNTVYLTVKIQSITDLLESTALIQAALAHILNAEGEKLQKIINRSDTSPKLMIETNSSVQKMVDSIGNLEFLLYSELENSGCHNCLDESVEEVDIRKS